MTTFNSILFKNSSWESYFSLVAGGVDNYKSFTKYLDFPHLMALAKTKLLVGKGYNFTTKDQELKKFFEKLVKDSRFQQKLGDIAYNVFKKGTAVVGFDKLSDGTYRIFLTSDSFKPFLVKQYEDIIGIYFWKEVATATGQKLFIQETWNNKEVTRRYQYNEQEIINITNIALVDKKYILPRNEPNKFNGTLPFHDFNNYEFSDLPDWSGIAGYVEKFNRTVEHYLRELKVNRTYLAVNSTVSSFEKMTAALKSDEDTLNFLVNVGGPKEPGKPPIEMFPSSLNHTDINGSIMSNITEIYALAGMSANLGASLGTGGGQETATEVTLNASGMTKTISQSKEAFDANMRLFLEKIFKVEGFSDELEWGFALSDNDIVSKRDQMSTELAKLQAGLTTRVDAIARIDNVSKEDAEAIKQAVDDEMEEMRAMIPQSPGNGSQGQEMASSVNSQLANGQKGSIPNNNVKITSNNQQGL